VPVIFLPLSVIILVSAIKDLYEDYKRQTSDREENNRMVMVLDKDGVFANQAWKDVRVGNIIKIEQDKPLPADLLLMKSSEKKGYYHI
jgi:phospholipid-transporting ATPase